MERQPNIEWSLIVRKIFGKATEEEERIFACWYESDPQNQVYYEKAKKWFERYLNEDDSHHMNKSEAWEKFVEYTEKPASRNVFYRSLKYAAVFLLPLCGLGLAFWLHSSPEPQLSLSRCEIEPGKMQATLTLGDGREIRLTDEMKKDKVAEENNVEIARREDGLYYQKNAGIASGKVNNNTLSVPRGGEYRLALADGTKIILNSDSRLVFPVEFATSERRVRLTGEAYFEVASNPSQPFVVETADGEVRVLGTEFNLSVYPDDDILQTTLVNGSVSFTATAATKACVIRPGEQVTYDKESRQTRVCKVNTALYTAWKEGKFILEGMRLEDIMKRLSRWYDVDVFFQNPGAKELVFTGDLEKYETCREILDMISLSTHVVFSVQGRTIIVSIK